MSQSTTGPDGGGDVPADTDRDQMITDEQLPEDLQPDKNPMARDPDDERNASDSKAGLSGPDVEGVPDMGS
jgi:hypothetical protein